MNTETNTPPVVFAADMAGTVGLQRWQFKRAEETGMFPARGDENGYLPEQVEQVRKLVPAVIERFGEEHPVGAWRCAQRLTARLGLNVEGHDITVLAESGHLELAWVFHDQGAEHDLYYPAAVDQLTAEVVAPVVAARERFMTESIDSYAAAKRLGWEPRDLTRVAAEHGVVKGMFGRYRLTDIEAMAADEDLNAQVRDDRLITADDAADLLDCARRHFDIAVEAKWISPRKHHEKQTGRRSSVRVPLYRTGDVLALLELPEVDWEAVRGCPKGEKSPLLRIVGSRRATRAQIIRTFLRDFGGEHAIEMWAWWLPGRDVWEIDWERHTDGPTKADVDEAIRAHPAVRPFLADMQLSSAAGAAIRFARAMLEPRTAVILDTKTTDSYGAICEIAVIDAATGKVLLDTLVNPGIPIEPDAQAIHGLTDAEVTADGIPDWPAVYRKLLGVTKNRTILAYNADYDKAVITAECARYGMKRSRLTDPAHWADVMIPRSHHAHSYRSLPNAGGHRALGDVRATRDHLVRMTAP
ncbi:3'-5' exonuclease [Nocardia carnea]|uniref:3'-5' exonuclease n=1 Tax=Nocardia carnea TaxID=37328 RepID=UPI002454AB27|nr:3'-5' exonuclease [Nocardia carnea]